MYCLAFAAVVLEKQTIHELLHAMFLVMGFLHSFPLRLWKTLVAVDSLNFWNSRTEPNFEYSEGIKLHENARKFVRVRLIARKKTDGTIHYIAESISALGASLLSTLIQSNGVVIADSKKCCIKTRVEVTIFRNIPPLELGE